VKSPEGLNLQPVRWFGIAAIMATDAANAAVRTAPFCLMLRPDDSSTRLTASSVHNAPSHLRESNGSQASDFM
jgi:hypothetical protein